MVAFFVISGYMLHFSMRHMDSAKQLLFHIKKRAIQCLIPWFTWGGVNYAVYHGINQISHYATDLFNGHFSGLWFLLCLFLVDTLVCVTLYVIRKKYWFQLLLLLIVGMVLIITKPYQNHLFFNVYYYYPFFVAGWLINRNKWNVVFESKYLGGLWILCFLCLVPFFTFSSSPIWLRLPLAITGTLALWFICTKFSQNRIVMLLEKVGKYTLPIYCIHVSLMKDVDFAMHSWIFIDFLLLTIISCAIALFCMALSKVFIYSPVTDLLLNGNLKKK